MDCDDEGNVVNNENDVDFKRAVRISLVAFDSEISNGSNEDDDVEEEYESRNNSIDYREVSFAELLKIVKISKGWNRKAKTVILSKVISFTTGMPSTQTAYLLDSSIKVTREYKETFW